MALDSIILCTRGYIQTPNEARMRFKMLVRWALRPVPAITTGALLLLLLLCSRDQITFLSIEIITLDDRVNSSSTYRREDGAVDNSTLKEDLFVVFVIPSSPDNCERRNVIRETWANQFAWNVENPQGNAARLSDISFRDTPFKLMFIFGDNPALSASFLQEQSEHDDMYVMEGQQEGRISLRYKVWWGVRRALQLYNFRYLLKTDDDVMVDLPLLTKSLFERVPTTPDWLYAGCCPGHNLNPYAKKMNVPAWKYCSGGGYVLSHDILQELLQLGPALTLVPQMEPEDMYTGWLVHHLEQKNNISITGQWKRRGIFRLGSNMTLCGWFHHNRAFKKPRYLEKAFQKAKQDLCAENVVSRRL